MNRLAGYVFDLYDDVDGLVLRSIFPSFGDLPEFVKTATRLSEPGVQETPDHNFALILLDEGRKMKKYAMNDAGNTALSVAYLLKQAHLLPKESVKIAASNLIAACQYYRLPVPYQLKTAADTGTSSVSGKSQTPYAKGAKVSRVGYPHVTEVPAQAVENPQLGKHDAANADVDQRTNMSGTPGTNYLESPLFPQKEKVKTAGAFGDTPGEVRTKAKSWRESPYFEIGDWDPALAVAADTRQQERTLLDGQYPIDGYDQVKTASSYFEENWKAFHPRKRHEYCVKLASRMGELRITIPDDIMRYGSSTYASDLEAYVGSRRNYVDEEHRPVIDMLLEKRAHVAPEFFAEALAEFDEQTGLRWEWDGKVADPWFSTFGPSFQKLADENWRYDEAGTRICEGDLENLAANGRLLLEKAYGSDFADEFQKKPRTVFDGLPKTSKLVVARMASDRFSGTGTD